VPLTGFTVEVQLCYHDSGSPVFFVVTDMAQLPRIHCTTSVSVHCIGLQFVEPASALNCGCQDFPSSSSTTHFACRTMKMPTSQTRWILLSGETSCSGDLCVKRSFCQRLSTQGSCLAPAASVQKQWHMLRGFQRQITPCNGSWELYHREHHECVLLACSWPLSSSPD
jgi:hypothetical protein